MEFAGAQFVAACVLVFGVLGALWLYAKRGALPAVRASGRVLKLEETLFIDARHKLVRVRHEQTILLILVGPNGAQIVPADAAPQPLPQEQSHA